MERTLPLTFVRDVGPLCLMIFLVNLEYGLMLPIFPLFVIALDGTPAFVGALSSLLNLARLASSVPVGMASDVWGRKATLLVGLAILVFIPSVFGLTADALLLLPMRLLEGLAMAILLTVGTAALSDAAPDSHYGMAVGTYLTAMGLGFSLGQALGGTLAEMLSFQFVFRVAGLFPLIGFFLVIFAYHVQQGPRIHFGQFSTERPPVRKLLFDRHLLPANIGSFLISLSFNGTVTPFFPLFAESIGIKPMALGTLFAIRTICSTAVRLPVGALTARTHLLRLMLLAVLQATGAILLLPLASHPITLMTLLSAEGIAFGCMITATQTYVTIGNEKQRGTVLGIYATSGAFGSTLGALVLGFVADAFGVSFVFGVTGLVMAVGLFFMWMTKQRQSA